ncbi:LysR family transcriptional regulator [Pendulispora albinea]|uniref:LysR family transcriptional regulator n=1 Tax=Pendulispora albinea TaxID=2741071 RepID=A0ABZ2LVV0_9BACT
MQRPSVVREELRWDDVRVFLALCRSRTVGNAGGLLGCDASTISRRLVALEEALGATLFDRGRDGITPTKAAEDLMPVAEEMEQVMTRFTNAAEGLEREVSGLVRLTCPPDAAQVLVAPLLQELLARHPGLRIDLDPGEAVLDLTRREADIALRVVRPVRGDLIVTRLTTVQWVLVASPKLAKSVGTLRAWTDAPWVGWGERLSNIPAARWFSKHVRGTDPVVRSDSLTMQLATVTAGVGMALVPNQSVEHYGLVPISIGTPLRAAAAEWPEDELFLVTHRALRDVPRVRAVWDLLIERAGGATKEKSRAK